LKPQPLKPQPHHQQHHQPTKTTPKTLAGHEIAWPMIEKADGFWFQKSVPEEDIFRVPKSQSAKIELKTLDNKKWGGISIMKCSSLKQTPNLNQETAPPPPQFFLVHPLRFSMKKHDA